MLNGQESTKLGAPAGESKYVDLYTNTANIHTNYDGAHTGDATKETQGWNSDYSRFIYSGNAVFKRGRCEL